MRRHPNYLWEQLAEDRVMADFIVDGIYLPPSFLKVALRAKTVARSVLVTDAAAPPVVHRDVTSWGNRPSSLRRITVSCWWVKNAWPAPPCVWTAAWRI
jgi:N-acetylglucosamine-6-phosphate deacetylase